MTSTALLPIPGAAKILFSYVFEDSARRRNPLRIPHRQAEAEGSPLFRASQAHRRSGNFTPGFDILRTMVAEQAAASTVEDEPPLPASRERFLTQPVQGG